MAVLRQPPSTEGADKMKYLVVLDGRTPVGEAGIPIAAEMYGPVTRHPGIYCSAIDWGIVPAFARLTRVVNPQDPTSQPDQKLVVPHSSIAFVIEDPKPPAPASNSNPGPTVAPAQTGSLH
jgi:hypothetical protein